MSVDTMNGGLEMTDVQKRTELYYKKLHLLEKWNELDEKMAKYPEYADVLSIRKKEISLELRELDEEFDNL
jgi:hypothetical protein